MTTSLQSGVCQGIVSRQVGLATGGDDMPRMFGQPIWLGPQGAGRGQRPDEPLLSVVYRLCRLQRLT